jgi:YesN/AraC family two-component response regulator
VSFKELEENALLHWHEFYEIEIILDGEGVYSADGIDYTIKPGMLIFMSPSSCHYVNFSKKTKLINMMFVLDACEPDFLYGLFENAPHAVFNLTADDMELIKILASEMTETTSVPYLSVMLNSVLGKIKTLHDKEEFSFKNNAMQYSTLYIQNHFKENLKLEDMAKLVNYSANYFGNKFKEYTGITFKEYIANLRFATAEKLLKHTALSITEICYQCGFKDFSNFMVYFKKRYGITPKEYRAACQKK